MSPPLIRSDSVSVITVLCNNIGQALSFYVGQLGFVLKCDEIVNGERLVIAAPTNLTEFTPMCSLRFREAFTARDKAVVGQQGGDSIFLQIECDDWETVVHKLTTIGTAKLGKVREAKRYRAITVSDPMGNLVNFVEKTTATLGTVFTKDCGH
ncbi:uncharacterized protein SPPG_06962 [Spizellomyces punctatus DAOM BR117]|uniref:VOC domain-containing protein n=1 Tax=Spizellomyces punctatus (strain DAOM BR117) TaxID=645134 RepID=A0A0L0HB76_SPIPD|nr:uncharacterized protein SPPG_06962 [Spizellomyces punctatus DAOM BR117]KNC97973.1 hypothetical protein SPPG_06962 [Spizellomyces punctatus DAOM BR117]|eukprot:XP_016606013.1 hypothetical protein SPPG_06962 [Spizellomyces punctatus DAOM BR117]